MLQTQDRAHTRSAVRPTSALIALCLLVLAASPVAADPFTDILDAQWSDEFHPAGFNGTVRTMLVWNDRLIVGGDFTACGSASLVHVGSWDGTRWEPLGPGLQGSVTALCVFEGDLVAGGTFTLSGADSVNHVARWDGVAWRPVGSGFDGTVTALVDFDGDLVAGGFFNGPGASDPGDGKGPLGDADPLYRLAWWNGTDWHGLWTPRHRGGLQLRGSVRTLAVHQNQLIAGVPVETEDGRLAGAMRWTPSGWEPFGPWAEKNAVGLLPVVQAAFPDGNRLVVAGALPPTNGSSQRHRLLAFDGARWTSLDPEISGPVRAISKYRDGIAFVGDFDRVLGRVSNRVGILDGFSVVWNPGGGLDGTALATATFRGELYVGGRFHKTGSGDIWNFARLRDGETWESTVPIEGQPLTKPVNRLVSHDGRLLAGDFFGYVARVDHHWCPWPGGDCPVSAARWTPAPANRSLGGYYNVFDSEEYRGELYLSWMRGLRVWDGNELRAIPGAPTYFDGRSDREGIVYSLLLHDGKLVVAGDFDKVDGQPSNRVAVWDGEHWSPLGNPEYGGFDADRFTSLALPALTGWDGRIVIGGYFREVDGRPAGGVAWWDGERWQPLGIGMNDLVTDLQVYRGDLYAAGWFEASGEDASVRFVARWTGTAWVSLSGGLDGPAYDLTVYQDKLVVAGAFTQAGGRPANHVAFWDGGTWMPLGSGVDGEVNTMVVHAGDLYLGGEFWAAGGKASPFIARWRGVERAEIASLEALRAEDGVRITWSAPVLPADHAGFRVYRQVNDLPRGEVDGTLITGTGPYAFVDPAPGYGSTTYWIAGVSRSGTVAWLESREVASTSEIPFALAQSVPNPFLQSTRITFTLSHAGSVLLRVFDVTGREVAVLHDGAAAAGENQAVWDGADARGRPAASGVYFYRLETPRGTLTKRLLKVGKP